MTNRTRTECPACRKSLVLTPKGKFRRHGHSVRHGLVQPGAGCCFMSFEAPADYARERLKYATKGHADALEAAGKETAGTWAARRANDRLEAWSAELVAAGKLARPEPAPVALDRDDANRAR